jgi:hypothetical protein
LPAQSIPYAPFGILRASAALPGALEQAMKSRLRKRSPRGLCRPDLVYAGVVIICIGLIARGTSFLP